MASTKAPTVKAAAAPKAATAETTDTGNGEKKERAPKPVFAVAAVDVLPPRPKRGGGKGRGPTMEYHKALDAIKATPGQWFQIAEFHTATGAATAKRNLVQNKRSKPEGQFSFDTRTAMKDNRKCSMLYARYDDDQAKSQ